MKLLILFSYGVNYCNENNYYDVGLLDYSPLLHNVWLTLALSILFSSLLLLYRGSHVSSRRAGKLRRRPVAFNFAAVKDSVLQKSPFLS